MWWLWFILLTIVVIYIILLFLMNIYANPCVHSVVPPLNNSSTMVTALTLGQRGNLGNQMFQLANLLAIASRSTCKIVLPTEVLDIELASLLPLTELPITFRAREDIQINATYYEYDNYEYITLPNDNMTYNIRGYRQAEAYFSDVYEQIAPYLQPKPRLLEALKQAQKEKIIEGRYLAIHLRYGDYSKWFHSIPYCQEFYPCSLRYYQAGIQRLRLDYPELPIYVCTNDREKAKSQLPWLDSNIFLAPTIPGLSAVHGDYMILYGAVSVVIANSTFSWWAAYSSSKKNIIMPYPWWHHQGFIGRHLELNDQYLYPTHFQVLSGADGQPVRVPPIPAYSETLNLVRWFRGFL
jgi:hypothetical protein